MPRIVTIKKAENERHLASRYLKNSFVYPSALLGLISLILGYGGVIYLVFKGRPTTELLTHSLVLLAVGLGLGVIQAGYYHYMYRAHHEAFADRVRRSEMRLSGQIKKIRKIGDPVLVSHPFRWAIPILYMAGLAVLVYLVVLYSPKLNTFSAIFLLLAGLHNARFFYLKRLISKGI